MQQYYNSISKQKRIAWVDNLTDSQAAIISAQYPFAVCFANNVSINQPYPVIWYGGKRYGFTGVNTSTITINNTSIGLFVSQDGILSLTTSEKIDNYNISEIRPLKDRENEIYGDPIYPNANNIYTLCSLYNQFALKYQFTKEGVVVQDAYYNINFDTNNAYTVNQSSNISIGNNILVVKKSVNSTQITSNISINGSITTNSIPCKLIYVPDTCSWIVNGSVYNSLYTTYQGQQLDIRFNFDDVEFLSNSNYKLTLLCNCNGNTYTYDNVTVNTNFYNLISGNVNNASTFTLSLKTKDNSTGKEKLLSSTLTCTLQSNIELIYIGENLNTIPSTIDTSSVSIINNFNSYSSVSGWHALNNYNFNDKNITINSNTIIIIPSNYTLNLPLYNNEDLTNPIEDPMWSLSTNTIINGASYKVYRYNTSEFGSMSNPKLLSIIYNN